MSATVITLADRRPPQGHAQRFAVKHGLPELAPLLERIAALPPAELRALSAELGGGSPSDRQRVANARGECEERERRRAAWRSAESHRSFLRALRDLAQAASYALRCAKCADAKPYADLDKGNELLNRCREADLELLLTPAPTVSALNEKKRMRSSDWHECIVNAHQQAIDATIDRDEAWLKANAPVRRKAVQS